jgi:hypothetical protein
MRAPFLEARVVVVLFRTPWGETPWTRVEQTAITDRGLQDGWDGILFVTLDSTSPIPKWVPNTRIRFNMETYGIEQAVGAIKFRVEQMGGEISKPSPMALAKRVKEERDLKQDQERLFRDQKWIEENVKPSVENLLKSLQDQAQNITDETDLRFEYGYEPYYAGFIGVIRYGRVSLRIAWPQLYLNVVDDVKLEIAEYNGRIHLQRERMMYVREPSVMTKRNYRPALNLGRELRWINEKKPGQLLSSEEVGREIIEQLLSLADRLNKPRDHTHGGGASVLARQELHARPVRRRLIVVVDALLIRSVAPSRCFV